MSHEKPITAATTIQIIAMIIYLSKRASARANYQSRKATPSRRRPVKEESKEKDGGIEDRISTGRREENKRERDEKKSGGESSKSH